MVRRGYLAVTVTTLAVVGIGLGTGSPAFGQLSSSVVSSSVVSSSVVSGPAVVVRLVLRGVPKTPSFAYAIEARCARRDDSVVVSVAGPVYEFTMRADESRTLGVAEFVGLTAADSCRVYVRNGDGAETSFLTTQRRGDGSALPSLPGVVEAGAFRSASARADGQSITVTQAYTGDLVVKHVVEGDPAATLRSSTTVAIACDDGVRRGARLGNGESMLFTGLTVGAMCRVTVPSATGSPVFADNSGPSTDGVVTVVATPADCYDLRLNRPECRVAVLVTSRAAGGSDDTAIDASSTTSPDSSTSSPATTQAAATTAPVVDAAPAQALFEEPTFTG